MWALYSKIKNLTSYFVLYLKHSYEILLNYYQFKITIVFYKFVYGDGTKFYNILITKFDTQNFIAYITFLVGSNNNYTEHTMDEYDLEKESGTAFLWTKNYNKEYFEKEVSKIFTTKYTKNSNFWDGILSNLDYDKINFPVYIPFEPFYIWHNLFLVYDLTIRDLSLKYLNTLYIYLFRGVMMSKFGTSRNLGKTSSFNTVTTKGYIFYNYKLSTAVYCWLNPQIKKGFGLSVYPNNPVLYFTFLFNFCKPNPTPLFYFYNFFKNCIIPVLVSLLFLYYTFFFFKLSFVKAVANWTGLGLFVFWLLSTFNFFIKRYRYGKYTSAIQRFWKRAFMCFWMIEGFLFIIFFYYLLNASSEPYFMYDTYGLYINQLLIIKNFLLNAFLVVITINLFIFILINTKFSTFKKNTYLLIIITLILLYLLFVESYQFYYLLNYYVDYTWVFSEDDNVWELDYDTPRTRNRNHYITLIIVAKFWHYIFIFASWVFFIMKTLELGRIRYTFLSMNFQNTVLFYIMNWLCLYSWLKWVFRRFMDQTYYWFFTSFRPTTLNVILNDFVKLAFNIMEHNLPTLKYSLTFNFYYLLNNIVGSYSQFYINKISAAKTLYI